VQTSVSERLITLSDCLSRACGHNMVVPAQGLPQYSSPTLRSGVSWGSCHVLLQSPVVHALSTVVVWLLHVHCGCCILTGLTELN
jgi:hypothetical protein